MIHLYLIGGAVAAATVFGAGFAAGQRYVKGELDALRAAYTQAALDAERKAREMEVHYAQQIDKVAADARDRARAAAADAGRARGELERLRAAAAGAGQQCTASAALATGGETAAGAGLVLADVLGRCGARLVELAEHADRAAAAGAACERAYDEVTR